jgi:hypothetical protein
MPPLMIVGWEGALGSLLMLGLVLPAVHRAPGADGGGLHENAYDTWHMVTHTPAIAGLLVVDMAALLAYNAAGMFVTGRLGAVFRTVLETTRTLFVWLVDLALFYAAAGGGALGESWSRYSPLQAAGFAVLVAGTVVYSRGDEREAAEAAAAEADGAADGDAADAAEGGGGRGGGGGGGAPTAAVPLPAAARAAPRAAGSVGASLKSSMNINAFGSLSTSVARRQRFVASPP